MNQTERFTVGQFLRTFVIFIPIFISIGGFSFYSRSTTMAELNNYSIDENRDIYSTFDMEDQNDQGLPLDPFDLMNRLKKAGAMDNATPPSEALDEALNAFDDAQY